jgi:hypothetical protein
MLRPFSNLQNFALAARDGEIGKVKELYFDDQSWIVRYVVVDTGKWLATRKVLLAPQAFGLIDEDSRLIAVHLTRQQIENSPPIETDQPVSRQHEEDFHRYYGYPAYWLGIDTAALTGIPAFAPPPMENRAESAGRPSGDPHLRTTEEVDGYAVHAREGEIGHVADFIVDEEGWSLRYVVISLSWLPTRKILLAPGWIDRVSWDDMQVFVPLTRDTIQEAPEWDDAEPINRAFEERLYAYYGQHGYWPAGV